METSEIMRRFNRAFVEHEPALLNGLIGADCVMETVQPAPDGERFEGGAACQSFWTTLASDTNAQFTPEHVEVAGDRATIRWHLRFGPGPEDAVRGVNLMRVRDGVIVEALGYSKGRLM